MTVRLVQEDVCYAGGYAKMNGAKIQVRLREEMGSYQRRMLTQLTDPLFLRKDRPDAGLGTGTVKTSLC